MPLLQRSFRRAFSSKPSRQLIGEKLALDGCRCCVGPAHLGTGTMMNEKVEPKLKSVRPRFWVESHNVAKHVERFRLAIRRQAHHLIFVAIFQESEILRDRAVVKTKRMRECDRAVDLHARTGAATPHRAREIAKPIRGQQCRLLKWGDEKGAGEMRLVMLDAMKLRFQL